MPSASENRVEADSWAVILGRRLTRLFDVLSAGIALVVLLPVFVVIALAIKFDDRGPVFYRQTRVGRHFSKFRIWKFRSMLEDAEAEGFLTRSGDSRQTRVGRFLRRYKLDELPQLLNVLQGDMQLVGARPEVERYVQIFRHQYAEILQERPGLTDPASLEFRHEEGLLTGDTFERRYIEEVLPAKLRISVEYQRRRTLWSDLGVLLRSFFAAIS